MVQTGLDRLIHEQLDLLQGQRVGLVTHPAAVLPDLTGAVDALLRAGVRLTALFGPEHGLDGSAADGTPVNNGVHRHTGLPIYSLYGATEGPTPEMLAGVDILVFDMQDVGVRFYTYMSTLFHLLQGAARAGKPVLVLDRPNPINGLTLEGPLLLPGFESFVGVVPVPIRHGLTLGEMARWMNGECALGADLTIVTMHRWRRRMWFSEIGLPWVPPSPAMPHLSTATLYPGLCLLEGTNVSEGRGTALPFEVCGAPWIEGRALAERLNALALPGVRARATRFSPGSDKFAGEMCGGVQIHVTERDALRPVALGLHLVATLRDLYPEEFAWRAPHFDRLVGSDRVRHALERGEPVEQLVQGWSETLAEFGHQREAYLLYPNVGRDGIPPYGDGRSESSDL
jgi:uncharacterized protein YbbC (DUF1343 family)